MRREGQTSLASPFVFLPARYSSQVTLEQSSFDSPSKAGHTLLASPQGQRVYERIQVGLEPSPDQKPLLQKRYKPGSFLKSALNEASLENERCALHLTTTDGFDITCAQIAGLVARRILKDIEAGTGFEAGQRYSSSASDQVLISSCRLTAW